MVYSLDSISIQTLKAEAKALREQAVAEGGSLSHAQALEQVAKNHGYRDWNTARAAVPERIGAPVEVGQRVSGTYLKQAFKGTVLGVSVMPNASVYKITIQFDEPVDVVTFDSFSAFRSRVNCTVDAYGTSPARTSDGQPHMRLELRA